jgi:membrane associated rhomboid family serine protease
MSNYFKYTHEVLLYPLGITLLLWITYWIEVKYGFYFNNYGVYPLKLEGLWGIFLSPFIHGSLEHLFNNTIPLLLLSMALFYFYPNASKKVIFWGIILSGFLTWLIGRPSYHIGASGLVYVLASFLFFKGIISKYYRLVALSLSVVFIYGSLIWGLFPIKAGMSWEGHLSGFIVGLLFSFLFKTNYKKPKFHWEEKNYNEEEDEFMQQFDEQGNFRPKEIDKETSGGDNLEVIYHITKEKEDQRHNS